MEQYINYYSQKEQEEAKEYFTEMIGSYMLQEQNESNPRLVIRKDDIKKLKALLFMTENLINRNKELERKEVKIIFELSSEDKQEIDNKIKKAFQEEIKNICYKKY